LGRLYLSSLTKLGTVTGFTHHKGKTKIRRYEQVNCRKKKKKKKKKTSQKPQEKGGRAYPIGGQ